MRLISFIQTFCRPYPHYHTTLGSPYPLFEWESSSEESSSTEKDEVIEPDYRGATEETNILPQRPKIQCWALDVKTQAVEFVRWMYESYMSEKTLLVFIKLFLLSRWALESPVTPVSSASSLTGHSGASKPHCFKTRTCIHPLAHSVQLKQEYSSVKILQEMPWNRKSMIRRLSEIS